MRLTKEAASLAAALLAIVDAAQAAPPAGGLNAPIQLPLDQDMRVPELVETPKNDDLAREYPQVPSRMGLGGSASMTCKALTTGRLDDCHVVAENPEGLGFGAATVRTAVYFRVKPATRDGQPLEGSITIPLRWQMGEQPAPQPLALAPVSPAALALGRRIVELQNVAGQMQAVWRPFLEQQNAQVVASSNPQTGQAMMDAFQQGLTEMI